MLSFGNYIKIAEGISHKQINTKKILNVKGKLKRTWAVGRKNRPLVIKD